jgi:hypothetical protein
MPDTYRGPYKADEPNAGEKYEHVGEAVKQIQYEEAIIGVDKRVSARLRRQIILPDGYLREAPPRERPAACVL